MICYDIADSKRLAKVSKKLLNNGIRVQYSFFQCELSKSQYKELVNYLRSVINKKEDKLYIYPLCDKCMKNAIIQGSGKFIEKNSFEIV